MPRAMSPDKTDDQRAAKVLRALEDLESAWGNEFTIVKISEPISSAISSETTTAQALPTRTSDVSTSALDTPTPASLEADLAHYKELFSKLRFSYVEQVTKEKFIRAIVGDPPLIVTPQENADLEEHNAAAKAALKTLKTDVAKMISDLETRGRDLATRYEQVQGDTAKLASLPGKIAELEGKVARLRAAQQGSSGGEGGAAEGMNLPLGKTVAVVEGKRAELAKLERQVELLGGQAPRKRKELERLGVEVGALENKRGNSVAAAREAKRRREDVLRGGVGDELEARGRWYRASEAVLGRVLGLEG